jgi:hypothetical protein
MSVDIKTLSTKLDGRGIEFFTIARQSPLLATLMYDPKTLYWGEASDLKPKELALVPSTVSEDGINVKWRDIDTRDQKTAVNGAVNQSATTIVVDDASILTVGTQIFVPSIGETYTVTGISTNDLTVTPSVAAAAGIADNADVVIISKSVEANGDGQSISYNIEDEQTNYIQEIAYEFSFNSRDLNSQYLIGSMQGKSPEQIVNDMLARYVGRAKARVFRSIAYQFYVGAKKLDATSGKNKYFAGGFGDYYSGSSDCSGSTALAAWIALQDAIRPVQEIDAGDGSSDVVISTTNAGAQALSNLGLQLEMVRVDQTVNAIGMKITTLHTIAGDITIMVDPVLQDLYGDTANVGYCFKPGLVKIESVPYLMETNGIAQGNVKVGNYSGLVFYSKPVNNPNFAEVLVQTNFSFVFGGSSANVQAGKNSQTSVS